MPFSNLIVKGAWERCRGYCECTNVQHSHSGRCRNLLQLFRRGVNVAGGWEAQHITLIEEGGTDDMINCKIVCIECYQNKAELFPGFKDTEKKQVVDHQS